MIIERRSDARGRVRAGWLDSRHTFSFGQYYDPAWMGFGALRVINEDRVAPGAGFPPHRHANMEILSYVLAGALSHKDSSGGAGEAVGVIRAGELQWMGAGHGVEHSEFNASATEPVHFLQIWLQPDRLNAVPTYGKRVAPSPASDDRWTLLASPDGADGSLAIRQQARMLGVRLGTGAEVDHAIDPEKRYWLHVALGSVVAGERALAAGDALGFVDEAATLHLTGAGEAVADVLLFELPRD